MSDDILAGSGLPVETTDDVAAEWSKDVYDPTLPQPILQAIICGQTAMLKGYQDAASYAANQSDPLAATDEYLDEIGSYEFGVHRQSGESPDAYRSRFWSQATVSPEAMVAAANAILAPYTSVSCVYFEHSDCLHTRQEFFDVVGATNGTPIVLKLGQQIPSWFQTGMEVTVSLVGGVVGANTTTTATVVMGPVVVFPALTSTSAPPTVTISGTPVSAVRVQIDIVTAGLPIAAVCVFTIDGVAGSPVLTASAVAIGTTGLTAHFGSGTYDRFTSYRVSPAGISLDGTLGTVGLFGNTLYSGGGSLVVAPGGVVPTPPWTSHVYGATDYGTQNYPDRHYADLPRRFSGGARVFSTAKGRFFWLLAPDISGIDSNVAAVFSGYLDIKFVSIAPTGVVSVQTPFALPPWIVAGAPVTLTGTTTLSALSGGSTFHVTSNSTTVTATGSLFTSELALGSPIELLGVRYYVAAIASDTSLTLGQPYSGTTSTTASANRLVALCDGRNTVKAVTALDTFTLVTTFTPAVSAGGGSVQTVETLAAPEPDGFFTIDLSTSVVVVNGTIGVLDASHALAHVRSSTGTTVVQLPIFFPTTGQLAAVFDADGDASTNPITVQDGIFEDPYSPGTFVSSKQLTTNGILVVWGYSSDTTSWHLVPDATSYVWSIGATAFDVYSAIASSVNGIRGHSIRWTLWADPKLN